MKATLFCSAVKTPFDSDYQLRVSSTNCDAGEGMLEKKLGSFQIDIPNDIARAFTDLSVENLQDLIFEANKTHITRVNDLSKQIKILAVEKENYAI